jgi:hypothetical protein
VELLIGLLGRTTLVVIGEFARVSVLRVSSALSSQLGKAQESRPGSDSAQRNDVKMTKYSEKKTRKQKKKTGASERGSVSPPGCSFIRNFQDSGTSPVPKAREGNCKFRQKYLK